MDTFIDSSWYFLRFGRRPPRNDDQIFTPTKANGLATGRSVRPAALSIAILHLLYSRFITKVLRDRGLLTADEPFARLLTQGMVQGGSPT